MDGTQITPPASGGGAPTGTAGGVLGGTYPDPSFAVDMATQAELNAHAALAAAHANSTVLPWVSGRYYGPQSSATVTLTASRIYYIPLIVPNNGGTISNIGVNVTTGAASAAGRCLLYAADATTGLPGALLNDPGADISLVNVVEILHTVSWTLATGGIYWIGFMSNSSSGTVAVSATQATSYGVHLQGSTAFAGAHNQGYSIANAPFTAPDPAGAMSGPLSTMPCVRVKSA